VTSAAAAAGRYGLDAVEQVGEDVLEELVHLARRAADVGRRLELLRRTAIFKT